MAERIPVFWDFNNIKLKQAQRELDRTRVKTRQLQGSANVLSKSFKNLGTTLLATFGAVAVLAAFRNMLKSLKDLEFQMSKVAAISGATSKQMIQLRDNAIKVGAASKFTATEVGKLQEELARLGFTTTEILKLTDSISALAIVADTELKPTAIAVAKTLNAFALSAEEGARVTNVMAESFAKSALDLEKFRSAMSNVGPLARVAGLSIEETTAILGTFIDNGIEASKAGTDLRRILLNVSLAGITLDEALEKLALSTDKVSTAEELFGARAAVAGIILQENILSINQFTSELSDSTREIDRMRRIMEDNLEIDLKKLASAFDALVQKGTPLNELLRDIVNRTRDWVNAISGAEPSTNDLKDQIAETEQQIEKLKKQFKDSGFGLDIYGAKAREADGIIKKLRLEVNKLKFELSGKEFLEGVKIAENAKIIEAALKAAFASDDIELFIKNLEDTAEKEEIIALIRREEKFRLEETNALKAAQIELEKEAFEQFKKQQEEKAELRLIEASTIAESEISIVPEDLVDETKTLIDEALEIWGDGQDEIVADFGLTTKELAALAQTRSDILLSTLSNTLSGVAALGGQSLEFQIALGISEMILSLAKLIPKTLEAYAGIPFAGPVIAALQIAAATALTVAAISRARSVERPRLKEGVIDYQGQGTETSDSNLVMISKGESIIKASATAKSKELLESINSGRLNDELSDILLNNKIGSPGNENVVAALMGVDKSIKGLPIHQTYFSDKGVARYIQKENSRVMLLRSRFINGK